jgi:hypothetical protein
VSAGPPDIPIESGESRPKRAILSREKGAARKTDRSAMKSSELSDAEKQLVAAIWQRWPQLGVAAELRHLRPPRDV